MFSLPTSLVPFPGQLPVNATLKVNNVLFLTTATAKKIVKFDMALTTATSYDPFAGSSGAGTSAWSMVRDYVVDTATLPYSATDVYAVADAAVATANTRANVTVIGAVSALPKVGSAAHVKGQALLPSMATIGTAAPNAARSTTYAATASDRKAIALCTNAATAAVADVHFNGFGWGVVHTNVAYNADP